MQRLDDRDAFRRNPAAAIQARYASLGLVVSFRASTGNECDIDGSYNPAKGEIVCSGDASAARQRFTILHELAHAFAHTDAEFADWVVTLPDAGVLDEERVANAFAAEVLLPADLVAVHIPVSGPTARDVAALAAVADASREAVCVRAAQRMRGPGLVTLSTGSVIQFAAARALPFSVRRDSDQGPGSFHHRASGLTHCRQDHVQLRLPSGVLSSSLDADAFTADDGYTFAVLMEHSAPWQTFTGTQTGPDGFEIDCPDCDGVRTVYAAECPRCGDRPCPDHGCSCPRLQARTVRRCVTCNIDLPLAAPPGAQYCDDHEP